MRHNCIEIDDYRAQAGVLKDRHVEKGYDSNSLQNIIEQVGTIDRSSLLGEGTRKPNKGGAPLVPFITTFSTQHNQIKRIIRNHWHLLSNGRVIKTFLPTNPQVVFRCVPSLRDNVAPNVVDPTKKLAFFQNLIGYHQCQKCQVCSLNRNRIRKTEVFVSTSTSVEHRIESFITCSTTGVVYLLQCLRGFQYVGRTKHTMQIRLGEHIANIRYGFKYHSVSKNTSPHTTTKIQPTPYL